METRVKDKKLRFWEGAQNGDQKKGSVLEGINISLQQQKYFTIIFHFLKLFDTLVLYE